MVMTTGRCPSSAQLTIQSAIWGRSLTVERQLTSSAQHVAVVRARTHAHWQMHRHAHTHTQAQLLGVFVLWFAACSFNKYVDWAVRIAYLTFHRISKLAALCHASICLKSGVKSQSNWPKGQVRWARKPMWIGETEKSKEGGSVTAGGGRRGRGVCKLSLPGKCARYVHLSPTRTTLLLPPLPVSFSLSLSNPIVH